MAKKVKDIRRQKMIDKRKLRNWNQPERDWTGLALENQEKVWELSKKDVKLGGTAKDKARASDIYFERIAIYRDISELLGVTSNKGECLWAIQTEVAFNKQLYKGDLEEIDSRDVLVWSLIYLIELVYGKYGYTSFGGLKSQIYNKLGEDKVFTSYLEAEEYYLNKLKEFAHEVEVAYKASL